MTTDNTSAAITGKPTTITAAEFVRDGYAAKIARGEVEVRTSYGQEIRTLSKHAYETHYMIWPMIDSQVAGFLNDDSILVVTWLPTTDTAPATAQPGDGVAGDTAAEVLEWVSMPLPADVEYDLKCIEGDGGEVSWARAHIMEQNRVIHELYSGKHGSIPHPAETWKAGLWEVYKPDEHQCHGERVGDVGELATLRDALADAKAENGRLREALGKIEHSITKQPERVSFDTGNSDDRQEYGYLLGLWGMSEIAREALAAADASGNGEAG